jgi:hypothetical protein
VKCVVELEVLGECGDDSMIENLTNIDRKLGNSNDASGVEQDGMSREQMCQKIRELEQQLKTSHISIF